MKTKVDYNFLKFFFFFFFFFFLSLLKIGLALKGVMTYCFVHRIVWVCVTLPVTHAVGKNRIPIIQLPECLMSTVFSPAKNTRNTDVQRKTDPHPYLLVVLLLP